MDLVLEPVGGLAGDMWLGLIVDLGVQTHLIEEGLRTLDLPDWSLTFEQTTRRALGCTRAVVRVPEETTHRHLPEIVTKITASGLPEPVKEVAVGTFRRLAAAEARVHRTTVEEVHFHEVGAADAIVDICGAALGLHLLGVERVLTGPLPGGTGTVRCAHGELPVPAPAVVELLAGRFELQLGVGRGEMVTPTGAALLAQVGEPLTPGTQRLIRAGYGAGTRSDSIVRGLLVESTSPGDRIAVIETWIDDGHPEQIAWMCERLRDLGALEVGLSPVTTKHGRPGVRVEVLARPSDQEALIACIFAESPTLGVRVGASHRVVRSRRSVTVETAWGPVRVKIAGQTRSPEFADCSAIARAQGIPLAEVYRAALDALTVAEGPPEGSSRE